MELRETAQSWGQIVERYRKNVFPGAGEMTGLVERLASSEFPRVGLCGLTSMHDLILGPSKLVLDNPYLTVKPDFEKRAVTLVYRDGYSQEWTRTVPMTEAYDAIVRFLTKRARWYR